jgi:hypothetical protein
MVGDRDVDDLSTLVRKHHENKEQPERDRRHDEQIGGHDLACMIGEEGPPRLRRLSAVPAHVFGNCRLSHRDAQLLKLAVEARCAPEWVCRGHVANQGADIG